jgi:hypothetical protein
MKSTYSSDSNSQKWSEAITVLGKGIPAYSNTYGCLIHCVAGVKESGGWVRLYPLFKEPLLSSVKPIENYDIIRVIFRSKHPEPNRPESRKIYPEFVQKIGHIQGDDVRNILLSYTEPGNFLHDDSWRGIKTLGMIKPTNARFLVSKEGFPMVKFFCDSKNCRGHICEVGELMKFDEVGRPIQEDITARIQEIFHFLENKELRFVMGTMRKHPQRWILIAIHAVGDKLKRE